MKKGEVSAVTALLLSYITFSMFRLSLGVAVPDIMVELSIDEFGAGALYSTPLWATAALLTPAGYLADRFGRKGVLLLGYLLLGLGVMWFALSSSYFNTLIFLALAGVGAGFLVPSYYSLVGEVLKDVRGFAIGLAAGVYNIGGLIGSILVGFFVSLHLWRLAYLVIAAAIFCMLTLQFILVKRSSKVDSEVRLHFISLLRNRNVLSSSLGILLGSAAMFACVAWLPTFFVGIVQLKATEAGLLLGLFYLAGAFGSIVLGTLSDRFRRKVVILLSGVSAATLTLPLLLTTYNFYIAVAYVALFGFLILPYWTLFVTIAQESVTSELVSSVTGLTQTFGLIGCAIGPMLAGALITNIELPLALTFTTTITILAYSLLSLTMVEKKPVKVE